MATRLTGQSQLSTPYVRHQNPVLSKLDGQIPPFAKHSQLLKKFHQTMPNYDVYKWKKQRGAFALTQFVESINLSKSQQNLNHDHIEILDVRP